eukprot:13362270-Alexandrium_andersonii.AAC.1
MSASLVGSEMCIRDSGGTMTVFFEIKMKADGAARTSGRCSVRTARRTPVSYTHLTLPTICSV